MSIFGIIPPPTPQQHLRARIWAAGALATLALVMALALSTRPKPPTPLDAAQLTAFADDAGVCRAALAAAGFEAEALPDLHERRGCGYSGAVRLTQAVYAYSQPLTANCATAAALALWERDVVAPAARRHLGQDVARIELGGPAYSCRAVAGRRDGRMSEHASANAVDISGFTLADGRTLTVTSGWRGPAGERAFLRAVRDGACGYFAAVLSPDYNRAHRDHLHFDLGGDELCR